MAQKRLNRKLIKKVIKSSNKHPISTLRPLKFQSACPVSARRVSNFQASGVSQSKRSQRKQLI
jgi:hypothetical protein